MANSKIIITFSNSVFPIVNDILSFGIRIIGDTDIIYKPETFVSNRIAANQVVIPEYSPPVQYFNYSMTVSNEADLANISVGFTTWDYPYTYTILALGSLDAMDNVDGTTTYFVRSSTSPVIIDTVTGHEIVWEGGFFTSYSAQYDYNNSVAENYSYYFNIDYNGILEFIISVNLNVVTIESTSASIEFINFNVTREFATAIIQNITAPPFIFTERLALPALNICNNVKLSLNTSLLAKKITNNNILINDDNLLNPVIIEVPRGIAFNIELEDAIGRKLKHPNIPIEVPIIYDFLLSNNVNVNIINYANNATITVNVANKRNLILSYSIDGINWQSSNIFIEQKEGVGLIRVKDQFGCIVSKAYEIITTNGVEPFLYISKANSISFQEQTNWDNISVFKTDENTLAYQSLHAINYCENLLFQKNDFTMIQFKSNYSNPHVKLRRIDGFEVGVALIKKTGNLNRFQRMDAIAYKYREGLTGIYFMSGNVYNQGSDIIDDYILNGDLPEMAISNNFITIEGIGTFKIRDVLYDSNINKKSIIIDYNYTGAQFNTIVESTYNLLPFEVYEFGIAWSLYPLGVYDILITNEDDDYETKYHLSENILLAEKHDNTLAIVYYNKNNRDIFYKYGIKHLIRVPFDSITGGVKDESEINITDLSTVIISSSVHETNKFKFSSIIKGMMQKLAIAFSSEYLFINGVGYAKDGSIEIESLEHTNLYDISATFIKNNISYNNKKGGLTGFESDADFFDIPEFVITNNNFIKV
jgi:hypothetical protein